MTQQPNSARSYRINHPDAVRQPGQGRDSDYNPCRSGHSDETFRVEAVPGWSTPYMACRRCGHAVASVDGGPLPWGTFGVCHYCIQQAEVRAEPFGWKDACRTCWERICYGDTDAPA